MEKFVVRGGKPLIGRVKISGAKNSAVAVIPAAILSCSRCVISNIPRINDTFYLLDMMEYIGVKVDFQGNTIYIDSSNIKSTSIPVDLANRLRASYYFLGALLGRYKEAHVPMPGGCNIGVRPIDQHIKGFRSLGAEVYIEHGIIHAKADKLIGSNIYLDVVSVGATINIMLAACMAEGLTVIENAAKEPHVVDVANFLNAMGASIKGAGTDVIRIKGVSELRPCEYSIIPDQIEAGTFMIAAASTQGDIIVDDVIPTHMEPLTAKLKEMGVIVEEGESSIRVIGNGRTKAVDIKTLPYPGFPTDLQQPMAVLLGISKGTSIITENVWESRFKYIEELKKMGLNARVEGRSAIIEGVEELLGAEVSATDLRAGAAMVVAALTAKGMSIVHNLEHIDRGYERIEDKFIQLGGDIVRVKD
ncbi:UDP-N-acetylglucosamine 1-carboxyvinyltransferase [Caldanaerobius fijiensis DSM 17918]|uniref:UDP-N-acetylglucosamine 1-carboxyvinyltransferase n=1 Tax=Caldanaerobius fijiensis DSM 17918 TaxID=1121256 RepID=A0A1M4X989_9THEO|nr:UDP-N-acetylglucosamine 1-carboxyvinyltransferase [Caldanaerobius fijiensis]SHE89951.1 UDP-N-acetylglucosamine 1-carboxyvinyltransferase [Caldanaerobius fijiensis DSM 17918]